MRDLHTIADEFAELAAAKAKWRHGETGGIDLPLRDRHEAADEWIAAADSGDQSKLEALRLASEERHKAVIVEMARSLAFHLSEQARKTAWQAAWRQANPRLHAARCKAWRDSNVDYCRAHNAEYRKRIKSDPVRAAYNNEAHRLRQLARRHAHRASNPLPVKVKLTPEQRKERQRAYDAAWQRKKRAAHSAALHLSGDGVDNG